METFFDRLKLIIDGHGGGKHTVFAKKVGIPVSTFHNIIKGQFPKAEHLLVISEKCGVSIDWLLTGKGYPYLKNEDGPPDDAPLPDTNIVEQQYMSLEWAFLDKQRALNINRELMVLEKLDPDALIRIESYIKGTVDTLKAAKKRKSKPVHDRRQSQRRVLDNPDQVPDGQDRRSGLDRRVAFG